MNILKETFGFDSFRNGQEKVINKLLDGESALAVFPTGSGKSLCFQYPAVIFKNLTVVVSPLIALMKDQVEFLQSRNIAAARLDSTLSWDEVKQIYSDLRQNKIKLLYVAPERLSNERFTHVLEGLTIDLMVIDEAHCISEWGHNFRPDYMKLARISEVLKVGRVLTLTATATPAVVKDICREFKINSENYVNTGFYRPNLELRFLPSANSEKPKLLIREVSNSLPGPAIVYVTLQKTAEYVAGFLQEAGIDAKAYHAGIKDEVRHKIQDWFMASDSAVVVATIAFGMGIDKANIRQVYHYNLPKSLENYSQEIGRAGRDGMPSQCMMFADSADMITLQNFTYGDTPEPGSIRRLTEYILSQDHTFDISSYQLSGEFDIRELVMSTYFTYLELLNILTAVAPYYSEYKVKFNKTKDEIYGAFNQERANFLKNIFEFGKKGKIWLTIDIKSCANSLGEERNRIAKALNYLEENGFISLQVSGIRKIYRFNAYSNENRVANSDTLIEQLQALFVKREERDIVMSNNVIKLLEHPGCKVRYILEFFGENFNKECGHCEWCITKSDTTPMKHEEYNFTKEDKLLIDNLRNNHPGVLDSPRQISRFLCGISSPKASRTRISYIAEDGIERKRTLTRHRDFGKFAKIPFSKILQFCNV